MEFSPRQVIQLIKLGRKVTLLDSPGIWLCASCHICEDRCPAGINISELMDGLRKMSADETALPDNEMKKFHRMFLNQIKRFGRVHEGLFMLSYCWSARKPLPDIKIMWRMFMKGRIDFKLPHFPNKNFKKFIDGLHKRGDAPK